jgi:hypothetical protein
MIQQSDLKRSTIICLLLLLLAPFGANAFRITPRKTAADAAKQSPGAQSSQKPDSAAVDTTDAPEDFDPYDILNDDEDPWVYDQIDREGGDDAGDEGDAKRERDDQGGESRSDQGGQGE